MHLDAAAVAAYLRAVGVCDARSVKATMISGGRSNLTFLLDVDGGKFILRRPPLGPTLATAHDVAREYRVLTALAATDFPVPRTMALCDDDRVLGAPFYVMEYVAGSILREHAQVCELTPAQLAHLGRQLIDELAALHRLDIGAVGLLDFGRPEGFMRRQMQRWTDQLAATIEPTVAMTQLAEGLARGVPANSASGVVHGDYRLDNCVTRDGRIVAVLDWEMSTLGDPLSDLATFAMYYDGLADLPNPIVQAPGRIDGFPTLATLLDRYTAATGTPIHNFDWYLAFAWFKLAVILTGVAHRASSGQTAGQRFAGVNDLINPCIDRGYQLLAKTSR